MSKQISTKTTIRNLTAEIKFLSTPSARRATQRNALSHRIRKISIHALREEGDLCRR